MTITCTITWHDRNEKEPPKSEWFMSTTKDFRDEIKIRRWSDKWKNYVDYNSHEDDAFTHWTTDEITP